MARPRTERPPVREAEIRAEPVREPVRKTRTHKLSDGVDPMTLPRPLLESFWQNGLDLQWNSETVIGIPATQFENTRMQQQGWEPVTTGMFDGALDYLAPRGHKGQILYGASRLDWRPRELTEEARGEEYQMARRARYAADEKIKSGAVDGVNADFMNTDHAKAKANTFLRKEHGRVPSMPIAD